MNFNKWAQLDFASITEQFRFRKYLWPTLPSSVKPMLLSALDLALADNLHISRIALVSSLNDLWRFRLFICR